MGDFFVRTALGQFDLDSPESLINLLARMASNKLIDHARKQQAAKRDMRLREKANLEDLQLASDDTTPSQVASVRELLEQFHARLTPQEARIAELRAGRATWPEIGRELGENPDALRIRWDRVLDRVANELGLESGLDVGS
jgi:DNA-directed RNA polymerase specialized sigma24 family protein